MISHNDIEGLVDVTESYREASPSCAIPTLDVLKVGGAVAKVVVPPPQLD